MNQCRVCWEDGINLVTPCKCTGTVKYIHEDCMKKEVDSTLRAECSVCKHPYNIQITVFDHKGFLKEMSNILMIELITAVVFYINTTNSPSLLLLFTVYSYIIFLIYLSR